MAEMSGRLFGGIDIGGTKILAMVVDEKGGVLATAKKKTRGNLGFKAVCERAAAAILEAADLEGMAPGDLAAIGIAVPSPVLPDGTTAFAPNLPGWKNAPLVKEMTTLTGRPCFGVNDGNSGVYAEYVFGAGRNAKTLVGLFVGTGIGGGMIIGGEIVAGDNCMAAEMGHIIVHEGGRKCGCGHRGCLEAYASKTGMARRIAWEVIQEGRTTVLTTGCPDGDYATIKSSAFQDAYRKGDAVAVEALRELAHYLGVGVAAYITLLGPSMIVVGGGVFEALGKDLLPIVKEAARQRTWPEASYKDTKIVLAQLGDYAVGLGAVAYARNRLDRAREA